MAQTVVTVQQLAGLRLSHQVTDFWELSARAWPGETPFLRPEEVVANAAFCGFEEGRHGELLAAAEVIRRDPLLNALAWHCHWLIFRGPRLPRFNSWPTFEEQLGERGGIFYLLVGLGMVPLLREHHRGYGVPEAVTRETAQQVRSFCDNHLRGKGGRLGIYGNQLNWMRNYVHQPYFRIGRFEYWLKKYEGSARVFRHRRSGEVLALVNGGQKYNGAGYVDGAGGRFDPLNGWASTLEEGPEEIVGHPISPYGMALREQVRLPVAEWQRILSGGELVLDLHIPAGGGMTPEAVRQSKLDAVAFFERYFPNQYWLAMICNSWMFNTQLAEILPPTSNLVRYQEELYLCPVRSSGSDGLWFIFLQDPFDPATAPRETSLQRDILAYLEQGRIWRGGAMFLLREHIEAFGSRYYRSHWPPKVLKG